MSPSSRGLGHRPFTAVTGVRIPLGTPYKLSLHGLTCVCTLLLILMIVSFVFYQAFIPCYLGNFIDLPRNPEFYTEHASQVTY